MRLQLFFLLGLMTFSFLAGADNWGYEPAQDQVPSCIAGYAISLPGPFDPFGPDATHVKDVLNKKGYTSNNDVPCGPNCYGVDYYVEINAALHDWKNGHQVPADAIRLTVHHLQKYTTPQGYDDAKEVGLYYSTTSKISQWDEINRSRMIKMIERLPTCADLRLKERRDCISDRTGCFRGIGRSGE